MAILVKNINRVALTAIGDTSGMLTVIGAPFRIPIGKNNTRRTHIVVECKCGVIKIVQSQNFGNLKSCGCSRRRYFFNYNRGAATTAQCKLPEYQHYLNMLRRCESNLEYNAKGYDVCDEWKESFQAFYDHVGPKPDPEMTIDRFPNPHGNYEPGNVRWATFSDQNYNRADRVPCQVN